jgi:hypothetical protein
MARSSHRDLSKASMGYSSDTLGRNSIVGNPFVIPNDSVYGYCVIIKSSYLCMRHNVAGKTGVTKVSGRDKSVAVCWKTKIEAKAH